MKRSLIASGMLLMLNAPAYAGDDLQAIRDEIRQMKASYEARIDALQKRLDQTENRVQQSDAKSEQAVQAASAAAQPAPANANAFNPEIALILSGTYNYLQRDPGSYQIRGFIPSGGEVAPGPRSFSLGESELAISANIDPHFRGNLTLALTPENTVSVENAYIQTLGLGHGLSIKAGRFFSGIGYMNEQHAHTWDFTDASLPYKAFLGNQFADDGVQVKWLAPTTDLLVELGAEIGRGRSFPATERNSNGSAAGSVFTHVGGDVGVSNSWRAGLSYLGSSPRERSYVDSDTLGNATTNSFSGKSRLWIADFVWKWAPNGNAKETNFKLQGEYFRRTETGTLSCAGGNCGMSVTDSYQSTQFGFYLQGVYQFMPYWRAGLRHDRLSSGTPQLGAGLNLADFAVLSPYNPRRNTFMVDYSPSEFSRIRLQYARDEARFGVTDNQFAVQYIMSLGAHGAHTF
jgi:hypothetical protein